VISSKKYGAEFGENILVASGLAQTAVHGASLASFLPYPTAWGPDNDALPLPITGPGRQPSRGISLLEVLRQISDSPILTPPLPYDREVFIYTRVKAVLEDAKLADILRIVQQYTLAIPNDASEDELDSRVEELIWVATLLFFATGREGRETRLDFFLMHLLTSSIFLKPLFSVIKSPRPKVALIRYYVLLMVIMMLARGRPLIRANLVQEWTESPRPVQWDKVMNINEKGLGIGDMKKDEDYNPWPLLTQGAIHHPDLHLTKVMRALVFASQKYGDRGPGEVIGAFRPGEGERQETFKGTSQLDGTLFVRAAGVAMDYMGWTIAGVPSSSFFWDRSVLGYDEAWAADN